MRSLQYASANFSGFRNKGHQHQLRSLKDFFFVAVMVIDIGTHFGNDLISLYKNTNITTSFSVDPIDLIFSWHSYLTESCPMLIFAWILLVLLFLALIIWLYPNIGVLSLPLLLSFNFYMDHICSQCLLCFKSCSYPTQSNLGYRITNYIIWILGVSYLILRFYVDMVSYDTIRAILAFMYNYISKLVLQIRQDTIGSRFFFF